MQLVDGWSVKNGICKAFGGEPEPTAALGRGRCVAFSARETYAAAASPGHGPCGSKVVLGSGPSFGIPGEDKP